MIGAQLNSLIENGLKKKKFTACAVGIQKLGEEPIFKAIGKTSLEQDSQSVDENTLFDLASLTKVVFTTSVAAKLFEEGTLQLDVPLKNHPRMQEIVELIKNKHYQTCTCEDILLHRAGFPMGAHFNESGVSQNHQKYTSPYLIEFLSRLDPINIGKTVYSDPDFIFMAEIFAMLKHSSTEDLWTNVIQQPWKLYSTKSAKQLNSANIVVVAAKDLQVGQVQDPQARELDKLCGHAGLFGNIKDTVSFGSIWLEAYTKGHKYLDQKTARRFVDPYVNHDRHLGWDCVSENSTAGNISKHSIGHLGYTGTSVWIDLDKKIVAALLTNRTLTGMNNSKDHVSSEQIQDFNQFRRDVYNEIWKSSLV